MLHGFISDATTYHSHLERLIEHMNVLTIDLPGHGLDTSVWMMCGISYYTST